MKTVVLAPSEIKVFDVSRVEKKLLSNCKIDQNCNCNDKLSLRHTLASGFDPTPQRLQWLCSNQCTLAFHVGNWREYANHESAMEEDTSKKDPELVLCEYCEKKDAVYQCANCNTAGK